MRAGHRGHTHPHQHTMDAASDPSAFNNPDRVEAHGVDGGQGRRPYEQKRRAVHGDDYLVRDQMVHQRHHDRRLQAEVKVRPIIPSDDRSSFHQS